VKALFAYHKQMPAPHNAWHSAIWQATRDHMRV
jgi:hypothetical protein